ACPYATFRNQMKACCWFEKVDPLWGEFQTFFEQQVFHRRQRRLERHFAIARLENDSSIISRLDMAARMKGKGKVDCCGAGVKEIKGPDVDGAASKVNTGRCGRFNCHCRGKLTISRHSLQIGPRKAHMYSVFLWLFV